jgi:S-adenosylmethionine:tRNA ribosyltransferase-isomerase
MMVVHRKTGQIEHKIFKDILSYFEEDDVFVFNDTRVFPARLYGNKERTGARIEVFLLRELNQKMMLWDVLVEPARKIRVGNKLYFGDDNSLVAEVVDNTTSRGRTIRFLFNGTLDELRACLEKLGDPPIPKILGRDAEEIDRERYQSIFATKMGAVSAPSAGLHFTREILKRLELKGIQSTKLTLHAGLGAFRPVEVEDLTKYKPESEQFEIEQGTCDMVNTALENQRKICAIGSTVVRALESSVSASGRLKPIVGWTDRFIFPPYDFVVPSAVLTNFHIPESTLLMSASAFAGYDLLMHAYQTAIKEEYKFFTYGDAMLII